MSVWATYLSVRCRLCGYLSVAPDRWSPRSRARAATKGTAKPIRAMPAHGPSLPSHGTVRRGGRRSSAAAELGGVTAELALATPLLLFLLLLVVQFGVWLHATHIAQAGADQGLAAARAEGGSTATGRTQVDTVLGQLAGGVLTSPTVDVTTVTGPGRQPQIHVEVSGSAGSVIPLLHLPVHVAAQGPREAWTTLEGTVP